MRSMQRYVALQAHRLAGVPQELPVALAGRAYQMWCLCGQAEMALACWVPAAAAAAAAAAAEELHPELACVQSRVSAVADAQLAAAAAVAAEAQLFWPQASPGQSQCRCAGWEASCCLTLQPQGAAARSEEAALQDPPAWVWHVAAVQHHCAAAAGQAAELPVRSAAWRCQLRDELRLGESVLKERRARQHLLVLQGWERAAPAPLCQQVAAQADEDLCASLQTSLCSAGRSRCSPDGAASKQALQHCYAYCMAICLQPSVSGAGSGAGCTMHELGPDAAPPHLNGCRSSG